ncbi:unnamed protein product, partial [Linum tenue]
HRHGILALEINRLLSLNWEVSISHTYRECNFAADFLAKKGHSLHFGTHFVDSNDPGLRYWLLYDVMGLFQERSVICSA